MCQVKLKSIQTDFFQTHSLRFVRNYITQQWKIFSQLSKSGIVTLVLISVFAGYLIGQSSELPLDWKNMGLTLMGVLFLASGSSALNQYQERHVDSKMPRTANRPMPSGRIRPKSVLYFIAATLGLGLLTLVQVNTSIFALGILAIILYNGFYTLWWKRHWAHAAVPGAVPGALPILMGYVAAQKTVLSPGGMYLFFLLFFWQMPHFWTLALKYKNDYAQGGFPTLPVKLGDGVTIHQIIIWCLAYIGLAMIAPFFIPVRWIYILPTLCMSIKLLQELRHFVSSPKSQNWLHFFLWVNFSLIIYLGAAVLDLWSIYLPIPHFNR